MLTFNLDGAESGNTILGHELMLLANEYLPTDEQLIPTGELRPVDGTSFDFKTTRPIRDRLL